MTARRPLVPQVSTCESTFSIDSGVTLATSPTTSEAMLLNHEYADPIEMRDSIQIELDKIDRRKKTNLIYEPSSSVITNDYNNNNNNNNKRKNECKLQNCCMLFIFLISSCALVLSLLTTFGILSTKACDCIKPEDLPSRAKLKGRQTPPVPSIDKGSDNIKIIEELKKNISILQNQISPLLHQVAELRLKVNNKTVIKGPKGDRGPPGTAGGGDLSKCKYRTDKISKSYSSHNPEKSSIVFTSWKKASQGFKIMGVTCATTGGSEYGLSHKNMVGRSYYKCTCAGKATTDAFTTTELRCQMHYWECPVTS